MAFYLLSLFAVSCVLLILTCAALSIYNLFMHPLSRFPGPRLWALNRLPYTASLWNGRLHIRIKEIHDQYGPIVRIAPDELSFIQTEGWQEIYTGGNGNKGFPKHKAYSNAQGFESLFDATDENHTRLRKLLVNNFFSTSSVNKMEHVIHSYTDLLIRRFKGKVDESSKANKHSSKDGYEGIAVNMQEWYNFATFDIAGKLTLNEDFGCLEGLSYHPWIMMVLTHFKLSCLVMCLRIYSPLDKILIHLAPASLLRLKDEFLRLVREKIDRRLSKDNPVEHNDFVSAAMKNPKSGGMSLQELEANCILMILAGSETMATSLLSATNFLCKNPDALRNLTNEIRSFKTEDELKFSQLSTLPYLNAVIRETHRLCPPLSNGPSRVVGPHDTTICGQMVPAGTAVGVTQYAANHSATNFAMPEQFLPERWLKQENSEKFAGDKRDVVRPFSLGARDCLGQNIAMAEFRVVLARMIWNFDISPLSDLAWEDQKAYMLWDKQPFFVYLSLPGSKS